MSVGDGRRSVFVGACVAAAYLVTARLGFHAAFVAEQVTTLWAPTGIALAALLLWGRHLWPAVWLGAFGANAATGAPLWTAAIIATGNTLEVVAAAWFLCRTPSFDVRLRRLADATRFIAAGALLSTTISATMGVTTLCVAGVQPWDRFPGLWSAWWLGDALGALVVAPLLVTTVRSVTYGSRQTWLRAGLLIVAGVATTEIVFGQILGPTLGRGPLHYVLFPFAIVAAVRFGQPATAMLVFSASAVTIWHTLQGAGPFASPDVYQGLLLLQIFMGVLASTGLLLAAAMTERHTSQRRREAAHAVGEVLADAPDLDRAAPAILRDVCANLEWQVGALWLVDQASQQLRCVSTWNTVGTAVADFVHTTEEMRFQPRSGLPGRVWATGQAAWIQDVLRDSNFPRAAAARAVGLHAGFGFPIRLGGVVLGVVEFFTYQVATPDAELLDTMSTVGNQLGQFMARKQTEEAIRVSEERFRSLAASNSALTLYEQDRELRYRWVFPQDPAFPHHNIGKTDVELLPPGEGQRLSDLKQAVLESGVGRREEISVTLPSDTRSYDLTAEPRRDSHGAIVGVSGVAIDITERKRNEQLLIEHKNALELIVTGHPAGECLSSVAGAVSRLSPHARGCVLVADSKEHFVVWHASSLSTSFVDGLSTTPMNALVTEKVFSEHATDYRELTHDDEWPAAWRELCAAYGVRACHFEPAVSADGLTVGAFMLCLDEARAPSAWERRVAEFGAHIASIVIERELAEQTLRRSEERLKEADRSKDEFLAILAHELRNPLAPIRTGLQVLRRSGDSRAAVEQIRPMMERQIGHMVRLVDDLLDVSRITSGKIHLQRQNTSLADLVSGAVEANGAAIDAAHLELTVQLPDRPALLFVDPTRFVQVISNLLNNAAKFTEARGQILLSAHVVDDGSGRDELVLSVSDTGIGISSDMLPRVFDLFTQGERSMHRAQSGLGIGLALARRIVEMHGGRIEARSDGPGRGSTFTIHMPVADRVSDHAHSQDAPLVISHMKRRVLVVDDNVDAGDALAALVRVLGGEAQTATDGSSAIQCASVFAPDIILLDIGMPGMDGYETCRRIRREAFGNAVFIAALTGWGQDGDKRRAADAGFDAHLTKPAHPDDLERLLTQARRNDNSPGSRPQMDDNELPTVGS